MTKLLMTALLATTLPLAALAASDQGTTTVDVTAPAAASVKQQNINSANKDGSKPMTSATNRNTGKATDADLDVKTSVSAKTTTTNSTDWFAKGNYKAEANRSITRDSYDARFAKFDTNADGMISPSERQSSGAPDSWFAQASFDANADGNISREEYENRFAKFDSDNDGRISASERSALGATLNSMEPAAGNR